MLYLLDRRQGSPTCSEIPSETARPYPGDGSNGANVLNRTGVVRNDIRSSLAGLSGASLELATVTGSVSTGFVASLTVAV